MVNSRFDADVVSWPLGSPALAATWAADDDIRRAATIGIASGISPV